MNPKRSNTSDQKMEIPKEINTRKLPEFIRKTKPGKNWRYLERYMKINEKYMEKSYNEIKGTKIYSGSSIFVNGIILEKFNDCIIFTTYTVVGGICMCNHKSKHKLNGNLTGGRVNMFNSISYFDENLASGKDYVDEYIDSLLKKMEKEKFTWDIESEEQSGEECRDIRMICNHCKIDVKKKLKCGGCMEVIYCGRDCQGKDWKNHRDWCEIMRDTKGM